MEKILVEEILEAVRGRLLQGDRQALVTDISTDSRTLRGGEFFLALKGERYDGHNFVEEALKKGAEGAIISAGLAIRSDRSGVVIQVADTGKALQDLAGYYRQKFNIPFVVITGTNGKTTTKDMAAAILARKFNVLQSEGSFNNQIGVPLTLLRLSFSHQAAVLEAGMSGSGEITRLVRLIKPQVGVLTNIGRAHLEFFKNPEEMARTEAELIGVLGEKETLILNRDDQRVWAHKSRVKGKLISFGIEKEADFRAQRIQELPDGRTRFILSIAGEGEGRIEIELPLPGYANIYNALAAAAISAAFVRDLILIKKGLESFKPSPRRMEVTFLNLSKSSARIRVIDDSYNANPESMKMALKLLSHFRTGGRKIAVLGDMLELGEWGEEAHREVGELVASSAPNILITVGRLSQFLADKAKERGLKGAILTFSDSREAGKELAEIVKEGDTILVKGSRTMHMEEVLNVLSSLS